MNKHYIIWNGVVIIVESESKEEAIIKLFTIIGHKIDIRYIRTKEQITQEEKVRYGIRTLI